MRSVARRVLALIPFTVLVITCQAWLSAGQKPRQVIRELKPPAGDRPVHIDPSGETVLPSGRLITPLGRQVRVAPHPYGLAISPDGKTLVTANSGTHPFSVSIITATGQPRTAGRSNSARL